MAAFLIAYSTVDGHTLTICRRLMAQLEAAGHRVALQRIDDAVINEPDDVLDPAAFDRVVIAASIRYGRHRPAVNAFVRRHEEVLRRLPTAFFSVNVVARKPHRDQPATNPYVRAFLRDTGWQPTLVDVFAGRIDYALYGRLDRLLIRFIMWVTRGPTNPRAVVEFTDWARVEAFGRRLAALGRSDGGSR